MSVERRVAAFLDMAVGDLDAAEVLARIANHSAAYHVQQGVEKLIKALLLQQGLEAGIEHRLEYLADRLAPGDAWRVRLVPFLPYSAFATAFRYPTPGGRVPKEPPAADVLRDVVAIRALVKQARGPARS